MDRNEEGNNSVIYRISSPTNADGAKRSPEKPNASALRKNSSGKLQNPNSSKHLINVCYVNNCSIRWINCNQKLNLKTKIFVYQFPMFIAHSSGIQQCFYTI